MRIAIHQPNFCPTKSYFDKIASVDLFVIMVHCQWEKGKYQNRFHVGEEWNTMSINHGLEPIKNKVYTNHEKDWARIITRYPKLETFNACITPTMWSTNCCIIRKAMRILGINTEIVFDYQTELRGSERLADICTAYNATEYLSGPSGAKYLDRSKFEIPVTIFESSDYTPLKDLI